MTAGFTLARWFGGQTDVSGADDDTFREAVLGQVHQAEAYAEHDGTAIVKTPDGVCMIEYDETYGKRGQPGCLVIFDYVEDQRWVRYRFWMNESSVADLMEDAKALQRADFEELFIHGRVKEVAP